jgi:hypothetical protein
METLIALEDSLNFVLTIKRLKSLKLLSFCIRKLKMLDKLFLRSSKFYLGLVKLIVSNKPLLRSQVPELCSHVLY